MSKQLKKSIEAQVEEAKGNAIHILAHTNIKARERKNGDLYVDARAMKAHYQDIEQTIKSLLGNKTKLMKADPLINHKTQEVSFDIVIGRVSAFDMLADDSTNQVQQLEKRRRQQRDCQKKFADAYHSGQIDEQQRLTQQYKADFGESLFKDTKATSGKEINTTLIIESRQAGQTVATSKPIKLERIEKISTPSVRETEGKEVKLLGTLTNVIGSKNYFEFGQGHEKSKVFFSTEQFELIREYLFKECQVTINITRESHSSGMLNEALLTCIEPLYEKELV